MFFFRLKYIGNNDALPISGTQAFKFDTALKGNSKKGHNYGTNDLTEQERLELLEYLKML